MKSTLIRLATVAALAVGMMLPMAPVWGKGYHLGDVERQARRRGFGYDPDNLMFRLNLSSHQVKEADRIMNTTEERNKPYKEALEQNGKALHAAFDSKNYSQIRVLTHKQNVLMEQMVAGYRDAKIKFYRILTPKQRVKADRISAEYRRHIERRDRPHGLG